MSDWPKFYIGSPDGAYDMPNIAMVPNAEALPDVLKGVGWEGVDVQWVAEGLLEDGKMNYCDGWEQLVCFDGVVKYFNGVLSDARYDMGQTSPNCDKENDHA